MARSTSPPTSTKLLLCSALALLPACAAAPHHHHGSTESPAPDQVSRPQQAVLVPHDQLRAFANNGNRLVGIATRGMGAQSFEVWRTSVAPGSSTPPHEHTTEEIFIFLAGQGRAVIGTKTLEFTAPATVIAPAGVAHQFINTGTEPTDAIVIIGVGSTIYDHEGHEMHLPWRN